MLGYGLRFDVLLGCFVVALPVVLSLLLPNIPGLLRIADQLTPWRLRWRLLVFPLCAALIFLGARSSLDHRPANISTAAFSNDQLVNRLGVNSTYSLLFALSNIKNEGHAERLYPVQSPQMMLSQIRHELGTSADVTIASLLPTLHHQKPLMSRSRPLNIVIILEESLRAEFVSSLGGKDWAPELDKLASQGLWLNNLYSTGTRSVRGIEAVVTGFPPSPGRSVVKLGLAQQNFFSLAQLLKRQGYSSSFVYGGESHFDNMRGFFLGNGFDQVVDQKDYPHPKFGGTWGVSDEDLFDRADQVFCAAGDQLFFGLVFSSSNHEPFDIPSGVVQKGTGKDARFEETVRYADYALAKFIRQARNFPYGKNTLFLVVADHDKRVFGRKLVPIEKFHIPGLFIGPGVPVKRFDKIASQIDLPVTLLSLAGIEAEHPMIGHDLLQLTAADQGRALMQFGLNHATMVGDQVIIHQPHLPPSQFQYLQGQLVPEALDPVFEQQATALALWPSYAYFNQEYRLSKSGK